MLKRSGRGHDPLGIESTVDGECAVECPACPHPGKNLPVDWQSAAESVRYVFQCLRGYQCLLCTDIDGFMLLF